MTQAELAKWLAMEEQGGSPLDCLDERELEVISLLAQGNGFKQAAREMGIGMDRFDELKAAVQKKLKLPNDIKLIQFAAQQRR